MSFHKKTYLSNDEKEELDKLADIIKEFYKNDGLLALRHEIKASRDIKKKYVFESFSKIPITNSIPLATLLKNAACFSFKKPVLKDKSEVTKQKEVMAILEDKINMLVRKKTLCTDETVMAELDAELEKQKGRSELLKNEIIKIENINKDLQTKNTIDYNGKALAALEILSEGSISNDDLFGCDDRNRDLLKLKKQKAEYLFSRVKKKICGECVEDEPRYEHDTRPRYEHDTRPRYEHDTRPRYEHDTRPRYEHDSRPRYEHDNKPKYENKPDRYIHPNESQQQFSKTSFKFQQKTKTYNEYGTNKTVARSFEGNYTRNANEVNVSHKTTMKTHTSYTPPYLHDAINTDVKNKFNSEEFPDLVSTTQQPAKGIWGKPLPENIKKEPVKLPIIEDVNNKAPNVFKPASLNKTIIEPVKSRRNTTVAYVENTSTEYEDELYDDTFEEEIQFEDEDEDVVGEDSIEYNIDIIIPPMDNEFDMYGSSW
jgi:hypothetical protein